MPWRELRSSTAILRRRVSVIQPETGDFAADPRSTSLLRQSLLRRFQRAFTADEHLVAVTAGRTRPVDVDVPVQTFLA